MDTSGHHRSLIINIKFIRITPILKPTFIILLVICILPYWAHAFQFTRPISQGNKYFGYQESFEFPGESQSPKLKDHDYCNQLKLSCKAKD